MKLHVSLRWVLFATAVGVLSACTSGTSGDASAEAASGTKAAGGQLAVAISVGEDVNWFNPLVPGSACTATNFRTFYSMTYRPIVWVSPQLKLDYDNGLATSITPSNRGQSYTIKLKQWKWSDGTAITARDIATYYYLLRDGAGVNDCIYGLGGMPDKVDTFKIIDDYTIEISYKPRPEGYSIDWVLLSGFPGVVALPTDHWLKQCPGTGFDPENATPEAAKKFWTCLENEGANVSWPGYAVVSGPYKVNADLWRANSQFVFDANPQFSGSKPSLDRITIVAQADSTSVYTGLRSGDLNVGIVPANFADQMNSLENFTSTPIGTWSQSEISLNLWADSTKPISKAFQDKRVRIALQHGTNGPSIVRDVSSNVWYESNSAIPPRPDTYLDPALAAPLYPFDLDAGNKILDDAGYPMVNGVRTLNGTPLAFELAYIAGDTLTTATAQLLQSDWKKLGFDVTLTSMPADAFIAAAFDPAATHEMDAWMSVPSGWQFFPNFYPTGEQLYACDGVVASYEGGYCSPELDALIAKTTQYADTPEAAQGALNEYQQYLAQNAVNLFTPTGWGILAVSNAAGGVAEHLTNYNFLPEQWYVKAS